MWAAADAADWWDRQHAESKKALDQFVESNPSIFAVIAATAVATAMDVAAGAVDALRLGKGVAEKGVAGLGEDALRALSLPIIGGAVAGAGGRLAKTAVGAVAKRIPKQAISAVAKCPLMQKAGTLARKIKALLGKNLTGKSTPKNAKVCTAGCPISMVTGEELLGLDDFVWDGPLELRWTRFYRTAQSGVDLQLGHGWITPLDEWLEVGEEAVAYHDSEGRIVELPLPGAGDYSVNPAEQLRLHRDEGRFRLQVEEGPDRVFAGTAGRCRLERWQNDAGQSIRLVYDSAGTVAALVANWGRVLLLQREGGRIAAILPARSEDDGLEPVAEPLVRYSYDDQGDLVAALDRLGHGERYAYRNHVIVQRGFASGFSVYFEWDRYAPEGRCLRNWGDGGIYAYRFEWLDNGISRAIDSRGGISEYLHDPSGLLLRATSPEGRVTEYAYDDNLLLYTVTDPAGRITRHEYDAEGRLSALTDPLGHSHRLEYDDRGRPTRLTDPLGQSWVRGYDEQGRLAQTEDPLGAVTRYVYNALGLPTQVIDALGRTRTLLWDEQARLVGDIGFDGVRRRYQYDAEDRIVAAVTQDKRVTQYQYDAVGRITAIKSADGGLLRLRYNAAGFLTHFTDATGGTTEYRYGDGLSQVTERVDPAGQVLRYHYDTERNLVGLTNAKGDQYRLGYDRDENLVEEIGFDGRVQRYRYDAAGALEAYAQHGDTKQGQPEWLVTRFQRDPMGRLVTKTTPDGKASDFAYDPLGRLLLARNPDSTVVLGYNALGYVTREHQNGELIEHDYDVLGRRTATRTPDGRRIRYRYDKRGGLDQIDLDGQPLSRHRYDEFGQEVARTQGDLVSSYDYDPMGRLLRHQAGVRGRQEPVLGRSYGYDAAGKLTAVDDFRQGRTRYVYDPAERLLEVHGLTPERFVHDPAGNLIGMDGASGGLVKGDRLLMLGDRHFAYDAAGNRIEEKRGKEGRLVSRYAYDGDNRLVRAETPQGISSYRYDALGRRIAKLTPQCETRFLYDGPRLLAEVRGEVRSTYVFEPGGFRALARVDRSGADGQSVVLYYHLDHIGTPREMTDAQGRIVWSARYRAYGALAVADVTLVDNSLRFQGQYFDAETGLHYNLNRYYDPCSGSFIHQDPIGLAGGGNPYAYAANPVNWIDPWGLMAKDDCPPGGLTDAAKGVGALKDGAKLPTGKALDAAIEHLGPGYKEIAPGVFKSADGTRMVRMTNSDLAKTGNHAGAPHMNFETGRTVTKPNGKEQFISQENKHIFLPEEN